MLKKFKYTKILTVIGILVAITTLVIAGGGHGVVQPYLFLFPFSSIQRLWQPDVNDNFAVIAALMQFPVYGLIYDLHPRLVSVTSIIVLHLLLVLLIYEVL